MEKLIPHIGKKPSPLSPYILHLYQRNGCVKEEAEDALTIAKDEVIYKLEPEVELTKAGMEESLSDPTILSYLLPHPPPTQGERSLLNPKTKPAQAGSRTGGTLTYPPSSIRKPPSSETGRS